MLHGRHATLIARGLSSALHRVPWVVRDIALTSPRATAQLVLSEPIVANNAISRLQRLGIVGEVTGGRRGRVYVYDEYLAVLSEGSEQ